MPRYRLVKYLKSVEFFPHFRQGKFLYFYFCIFRNCFIRYRTFIETIQPHYNLMRSIKILFKHIKTFFVFI